MRSVVLALVIALVPAASVGAASGAGSPALRAKQAEAQKVLRRVRVLDVRFGKVVDRWDGARIQLAASRRELAANRRALTRARRQTRIADERLARVVVAIYENGPPTLPEIIVGASSVSGLIDGIEAAQTIDAYDKRIADQARRWQARLAAARTRLKKTERTRRRTVSQLAAERKQIGALLTSRRRLLASVQSEVEVLQAREAARQRALAAAARARLARERAAQAAARAAAERAAAVPATAPAAPPATTTSATTTAAATTVPAPGATTTAAATTTTAPAPATLGPGHPQAATIALRYLGIPYLWGGASPATGFDCSGFVMYVYAQLGIQLPHQSAAQYTYGVPVPRAELQPGDLVFYDGLSHVGIYIGGGEIVHAPQTGDVVKISPLSQGGFSYDGARRL